MATIYVVLKADEQTKVVEPSPDPATDHVSEKVVRAWVELARVEASGRDQAIGLVRADMTGHKRDGQFIAVPVSSFRPMRFWTETKPVDRRERVA